MYLPKGNKQTEVRTMTSSELRTHFTRMNNNTTISKKDFEHLFYRTNDSIDFTFNGWDGKSYGGESRHARIWQCSVFGFLTCQFVKVGKSIHMVDDNGWAVELATGKKHHTVSWLIDVDRA